MSNGDLSAPIITGASGSWLHGSDGRTYIDLCMGYGSVWLGHGDAAVNGALEEQLRRYSAPGFLQTPALPALESALTPLLPSTHFLAGVYSTGMEAMETAIRVAWAETGRLDLAGFEGSTHGRSYLTASLGGDSPRGRLPFVHRLPGFYGADAQQLTEALNKLMDRIHPAAFVVEPVQMTGGGCAIPRDFARALAETAASRSVPLLFDETLTGLYRCGRRFWFECLPVVPDILVIGKGMANGFPCAALVLRRGMAWNREHVKPGSTFWNHPLACASAIATLRELAELDALQKVSEMESIVRDMLGGLEINGQGALWCLGIPDRKRMAEFTSRLREAGIIVSFYDRYVRLLPAIKIDSGLLIQACNSIRKSYADTFG